MPKLLSARPPLDAVEERRIRKLAGARHAPADWIRRADRKSTRLNSSHDNISYAVFCLKKIRTERVILVAEQIQVDAGNRRRHGEQLLVGVAAQDVLRHDTLPLVAILAWPPQRGR